MRPTHRFRPMALLAAAWLLSGLNCPFLPTATQQGAGEGGVVTVQIENRSGLRAAVVVRFLLSDNRVRETSRMLDISGLEAMAALLPTRTHSVQVRATIADDAKIPAQLTVAPGDVLLEAEFIWQQDFADGEALVIILHAPGGAPDFVDCNSNGQNDAEDIATGTSADCQPNGIPDECDLGEQLPAARTIRGGPPPSSLLFPLDGDFVPAMAENDDDSSEEIALGFGFDFYGTTYTSVYINNNGNLSFDNPFSTFTSTGFPVNGFPMIAPFWADVDTRMGLGQVWYKIVDNTLIVIWQSVGYFDEHGDKLNTFEVAISDGNNPQMGVGVNVVFCYDDMQWTTGDASDGDGGFSGTPATVGANKGDGETFFQIGLFDHAGDDYDGPADNNDGVSFLDHQCYSFSTVDQGGNVSPVVVGLPPQKQVRVNPAQNLALDLTIQFLSPEFDQTTDVAVVDVHNAAGAGFTIASTPGNVAEVQLSGDGSCAQAGVYRLEMFAADDFDPPGQAHASLTIVVDCHSLDCNGNHVPDECEEDCNGNGIPDDCDAAECPAEPWCSDCNDNGRLDACDIATSQSADDNENDTPDECEDVLQARRARSNSKPASELENPK